MNDKDTDELIKAWHRFFANIGDRDKREPDHWAALQVRRLLYDSWIVPGDNEGVVEDPDRAWKIILLLLKESPSRKGLIAVVSGPLRQLMHSHFTEYIDKVKEEVHHNSRLSFVLSQIYIHNDEHRTELHTLGSRAVALTFPDETAEAQREKINRIVTDWFLFKRAEDLETREAYLWAILEVSDELPVIDPNTCWAVILALMERANSGAELRAVGFEIGQLLCFNYADFIGIIRDEVAHNKRLAYALGNAYLSDDQKTEWKEFIALVDQHRTDDPFSL
ncbi:MAG TPA: hypothetical protein V6C81_14295 [Planktothrix sp.]